MNKVIEHINIVRTNWILRMHANLLWPTIQMIFAKPLSNIIASWLTQIMVKTHYHNLFTRQSRVLLFLLQVFYFSDDNYIVTKSFSTRFNNTAFVATIMDEILIRSAANSGRSIIPKLGYRIPPAIGIARTL